MKTECPVDMKRQNKTRTKNKTESHERSLLCKKNQTKLNKQTNKQKKKDFDLCPVPPGFVMMPYTFYCQSGKNTESVTWWHQRVYFVPVTVHVMIQPIRKTVGDLTLISGGARIIETYAYQPCTLYSQRKKYRVSDIWESILCLEQPTQWFSQSGRELVISNIIILSIYHNTYSQSGRNMKVTDTLLRTNRIITSITGVPSR